MDQGGKEEVKEDKQERPQKRAAKPVPPATIIYVGPNLPGGILAQYTTYRGGLPGHVENLLADKPAIRKLFIPVTSLKIFQTRVATPGTAEHRAYQDVLGGM